MTREQLQRHMRDRLSCLRLSYVGFGGHITCIDDVSTSFCIQRHLHQSFARGQSQFVIVPDGIATPSELVEFDQHQLEIGPEAFLRCLIDADPVWLEYSKDANLVFVVRMKGKGVLYIYCRGEEA